MAAREELRVEELRDAALATALAVIVDRTIIAVPAMPVCRREGMVDKMPLVKGEEMRVGGALVAVTRCCVRLNFYDARFQIAGP